MTRRKPVRPIPQLDLRRDPWIPGLRISSSSATTLAASLRLDVHRPCTYCGEPTWLHRRDVAPYDIRSAPVVRGLRRRGVRRDAAPRQRIADWASNA